MYKVSFVNMNLVLTSCEDGRPAREAISWPKRLLRRYAPRNDVFLNLCSYVTKE
jgi:hypothetical protein